MTKCHLMAAAAAFETKNPDNAAKFINLESPTASAFA
jgi:hypothetical protein